MIRFDPIGWLENIVPGEWIHRVIRLCAFSVVFVFFIMRIGQYRNFYWKPLWAAETLLFAVAAIAFIVRTNPVDRSHGIKEIIIPLIASVLPFALLTTHPSQWIIGNKHLLAAVFMWMTLSTALTAWGMWTLRRCFSITVEARDIVNGGPYRWLRHPIYLGEMLSAAAVVAWRWSWLNVLVLMLFVIIQLLRANWEESKLARVFPSYRDTLVLSRWFWKI